MKRFFFALTCLAALAVATGCTQKPEPGPKSPTKAGDDDHGHSHADAPHGGTMTDWGGGAYHVEFTVDHDKQEATVYIIGSDAKSPAPVKADKIQLVINDPMTEIDLVAQPLEGEAEGMSSRFVGTHETIGIVKEFSGTISGEVEGTPYSGDFKEEPHIADHKH